MNDFRGNRYEHHVTGGRTEHRGAVVSNLASYSEDR
jgi:hypothetical protein